MNAYTPPFKLTNTMLDLVASISEKVGRITTGKNLESKPHLRKNNRVKSIYSSLKIEANSLTIGQVRDVIDGKLVLGEQKEIQEVKNAYEAYEKINKIDPYDIEELKPKVILPSSQRELDIETLNMLVKDSPDFRVFIEDINNIIKAKSSNLVNQIKDSFDKVFDSVEGLEEYIEKNIK